MEQNNQIFSKLAKAQAKMSQPAFDSENPHFHNKYASLASIMGVVLPALNEQGLFLTQGVLSNADDPRFLTVVTAVYDDVARAELSYYPVNIQGCNAQQIGSAITYAKRYSLASVFCRVADEDDDGEAVRVVETTPKPKKVRQMKPNSTTPVEVVNVNPVVEAKDRLWTAIQSYCEQHGGNPREIANNVFADKPAEDWALEEFEAKAAEFEGELV